MCGFSGLPKLRQLVRPSGSAPTQARLRAHSSTASTAPVYGSQATRRPLPSIETAIAPLPPSPASVSTAASAALRPAHRARADDRVVLLEDAALGGDVRRAEQREQRLLGRGVLREARRRVRVERALGLDRLEVVQRAVVDERLDRHVADELVAVEDTQLARIGDLADRRRAHLPALAQVAAPPSSRSGSTTHSIRSCDSEIMISKGSMSGSRSGHARYVDVEPHLALRRHLGRGGGEPRRTEVLQRAQQAALEQLEAALDELRLLERIADLHARALRGVLLGELRAREHRGAADAVAAGAGAEQHEHVARRRRRRCGSGASCRASPTHMALTRQFCS